MIHNVRDALVGLHSTIRSPLSLELHAHWRDGCFGELCKNSWTSCDAVRGVGARNRVCPDPFPHGNGHFLVEILGYAQTGPVNILGILNTISKWAAAVQSLATCSVATCLKKVAHTRLPNVGFRSWSWLLAVSLQVTRVIKPAVGCQYFPPGLQLPSQPLRGLQPVSLLGEQRHAGCEQFAQDCYPRALWLRFGPYCAWVQHANHSATKPPNLFTFPWFLHKVALLKEAWGSDKVENLTPLFQCTKLSREQTDYWYCSADTIRDAILTCAEKADISQLNLHGTKK